MSTLSAARPTLIDHARAHNNGRILKVAEVLQQYNDILDDIVFVKANQATGHVMGIRSSKPTPSFRLINQGVVPQKATSAQITESIGMLEDRNQIDIALADLNGNTEAFRMGQDKPMMEGMADKMAATLIRGDVSTAPAEFNGLESRYFSLGSTFTTSTQLIDGGGVSSDNTSVWLVCWGEDKVFCTYPPGSIAGLQHKDLGRQEVTTDATTGARMSAYESWMRWDMGLCVQDYRYVVRICNIDVSNLLTASDASDTSANLLKLMIRALGKLPPHAGLRPVFYMSENVQSMLAVKLLDKGNNFLTMGEIKGVPVFRPNGTLMFQGVPCRRVDAITETESRITTATT